jgi:hypothetical protein
MRQSLFGRKMFAVSLLKDIFATSFIDSVIQFTHISLFVPATGIVTGVYGA